MHTRPGSAKLVRDCADSPDPDTRRAVRPVGGDFRTGRRPESVPAPVITPTFETYLESLRQQAGIPGLSAAIVKDGQIAWERGLRLSERRGADPRDARHALPGHGSQRDARRDLAAAVRRGAAPRARRRGFALQPETRRHAGGDVAPDAQPHVVHAVRRHLQVRQRTLLAVDPGRRVVHSATVSQERSAPPPRTPGDEGLGARTRPARPLGRSRRDVRSGGAGALRPRARSDGDRVQGGQA